MFDLNTVLSAAIAAAVEQHISTLQQAYANKMAEMAEKIDALEARVETLEGVDHERNHALTLRYLGGARDDIDALKARVWALENNPATGETLSPDDLVQVKQRIEALEMKPTDATPENISCDAFVVYLDNQEWFWEKLLRKAGEAAQSVAAEAISDHCADHDHDSYDNAVSELEDLDMDDFVRSADIEEAVNDALDSVTFTVRINR